MSEHAASRTLESEDGLLGEVSEFVGDAFQSVWYRLRARGLLLGVFSCPRARRDSREAGEALAAMESIMRTARYESTD